MSTLLRGTFSVVIAASLALAVAGRATAAEYTLTVEPSFPANQIREVYEPLLGYLNRATGYRFSVRVAPNFNQHWRDLRARTKTDFVFEEGHFFDYRRQHSGFVGLARTVENSAFVIAVADPEIAAEGRDGIIGRTVASMGTPNLGNLLVSNAFDNPLSQPELRGISSKWSDGPDLVFAGDVYGALLPTFLAAEHPALIEVWRSREVPGRVFSASPDVPQDVRSRVAEALRNLHADPEAFSVMHELRTERMVALDEAAYDGMQRLLINTFGYVPPTPQAPPAAPATPAPAPTAAPPRP